MNICRWCGVIHGPRCPEVRAIEYHEDGTVKRVEFLTPADFMSNGAPLLAPGLFPTAPSAPYPTTIWCDSTKGCA